MTMTGILMAVSPCWLKGIVKETLAVDTELIIFYSKRYLTVKHQTTFVLSETSISFSVMTRISLSMNKKISPDQRIYIVQHCCVVILLWPLVLNQIFKVNHISAAVIAARTFLLRRTTAASAQRMAFTSAELWPCSSTLTKVLLHY